ncbi:hypothetical protein [Couchioplanes caeruleus]|uniref:Secreted protein n=2 Tax=Couchioplanes caeruleus TaxID=56438 RepID=A0A1K0GWZ8_9ACTN|nr:hypothetical protein [Couchioplanes caeruleus]OJF13939.1 hypothetical protein BG844_12630 [Couchioplanes caeruleus subsp. caeruleus]ROP34362.1 hypothetical protein EDD30_7443 [Couchioplanes caeruleus]
MKSLARACVIVTMAGIAVGALAGPASAADNTFELATGSVSAYGTYDRMMSIPERPVPPIRVSGTLAVNSANRCGVVQIAYNGPADGIEWRTFGQLCGKGKTNYTTTSNMLFGGFQPQVRLCKGTSVKKAERGTSCDTFTPVAD